jgi:hypothetical protein
MGVKITDTTLRDAHPVIPSGDHARTGAMTVSARESGAGQTAVLVAHRARTTNMETGKPWA